LLRARRSGTGKDPFDVVEQVAHRFQRESLEDLRIDGPAGGDRIELRFGVAFEGEKSAKFDRDAFERRCG
jgi:hypothetical protein